MRLVLRESLRPVLRAVLGLPVDVDERCGGSGNALGLETTRNEGEESEWREGGNSSAGSGRGRGRREE